MRSRWLLLAALGSLLGSCGGNKASFSLVLEPASLIIPQGSSADVLIKLTRLQGFTGEVTIRLDNPPDGLYADSLTLPAQKSQGVLEVRASPDAPLQGFNLKLSAQSGSSPSSAPLSVTVAAAAPSSQELIAQALQAGQIDYPTSVLYRAYALFGDPRLPQAYQGSGSSLEDEGFFFEARQPDLPAAIQTQLRPFLVRPSSPESIFNQPAPQSVRPQTSACPADTDPGATGWRFLKAVNYPIRVWVKCGADAEADDFDLTNARSLAESIWKPMTDLMGPPIPDAGSADEGGDSAIDFYLLWSGEVLRRGGRDRTLGSPNILAFAPSSPPYSGKTSSGYMVLRRERLLNSGFKSDVVHEFFHILQSVYNNAIGFERVVDGYNEFWYTEASAVWAESRFARATSDVQVHKRFTERFQRIKTSLHRSVPSASSNASGALAMYASYIYPFFMEQKDGGPSIIQQSWEALRTASSFDQANQALDRVFDFKNNFRLFAVNNYNANLPGVLDADKRYKAFDPKFPDGVKPTLADEKELSGALKLEPAVDIAPLRAAYYKYRVTSLKLKKVIFNFEGIGKDGLDIDGLVQIGGRNWEKQDYTSQKEVKFCLDKPEEQLENIILVLSNRNLPLSQFVLGTLKVEASEAPCGGSWTGTSTALFGGYTLKAEVTFNIVDGLDPRNPTQDPNLLVFSPVGRVSFSHSHCSITPSTQDISPWDDGLIIDYSTDPPTYKAEGHTVWAATYICDGQSGQAGAGGAWLSDFNNQGYATGTLSDGGNTIQGSASAPGYSWTWKFTKN